MCKNNTISDFTVVISSKFKEKSPFFDQRRFIFMVLKFFDNIFKSYFKIVDLCY